MPKERRNGKVVYVKIKTKDRMLPMIIPTTQPKPKNNNPLSVKGTPATAEEALARVNADNYNKEHAYQINCQRCVWAYEAQRRGYDVEALPNYDNLGSGRAWLSIAGGKDNFKGMYLSDLWESNKSRSKEAKKVKDTMAQWGDGSRGIITIRRRSGSGHVFNVEYKKGKVTVFEAQTGEKINSLANYMKDQKAMLGWSQLFRTDNVKFVESEAPKYFKTRGN